MSTVRPCLAEWHLTVRIITVWRNFSGKEDDLRLIYYEKPQVLLNPEDDIPCSGLPRGVAPRAWRRS